MKAQEFADLLPVDIIAADDAIIQAVRDGHGLLTWYELPLGDGITIEVTTDVLRIGEPGDALRVNMSATGMQRLADVLGGSLLTTKVADAIHRYATLYGTVLPPTPQAWWKDGTMGTVPRMLEQSRIVDAQLRAAQGSKNPKTQLVSGPYKDWILSARLNNAPIDTAANFGFYDPAGAGRSPGGLPVHQSVGLAHNRKHRDYSQGARFMRKLRIRGALAPIETILCHPIQHVILSDEGVITRTSMLTSPPPMAPQPTTAVLPTLREGSRGEAVKKLQRLLGVNADGIFGSGTKAAVIAFQTGVKLTPDGVVGPKTWAALEKKPAASTPAAPVDNGVYPFIKAKHFRAVPGGRTIDLIVLHTAEVPEHTTSAEAVARYFQNPIGPKGPVTASAHFCVDSDSIVQCVHVDDVAYAAPDCNHNGIQIELSGYAKQTAEDWADPYSQTMLRRAARLVAKLCGDYSIPMEFVDAEGLKRGQRGITTHHEATKAFPVGKDGKRRSHVDPGKNFPMEQFLDSLKDF